MKRNSMKKALSVVLCVVLIAALALLTVGCADTEIPANPTDPTSAPASGTPATVLGEGARVFTCIVADTEGTESVYEIHTDETIVGVALEALGLLEGEEGPYGLYIKAVNGITLDYEADGKYWAFYIDGEYALTGVDQTEITDGATYSFRAEE